MLTPGKKPKLGFKVSALVNGVTLETTFAKLLAEGPTVVSVWMRNHTSSCDKQSVALAKHEKDILKAGYRLIGISRDSCGSHAKYAAKHALKYTLVADPEDQFSKALDAIIEKSMYGKKYQGPARAAYVFDTTGKLTAVIEKVDAAEHGKQVLDVLKNAQ
jgi:peroxiredoxin Q/BCP